MVHFMLPDLTHFIKYEKVKAQNKAIVSPSSFNTLAPIRSRLQSLGEEGSPSLQLVPPGFPKALETMVAKV